MTIKERFEQYNIKDKVLLYLIVLMVNCLVYIFYDNLLKVLSLDTSPVYKKVISPISKIKRLSDLELMNYFTVKSKKHKLSAIEMKISQSHIYFKGIGLFVNVIPFLNAVEQNFRLQRFEITYNEHLEVTINVNKKYYNTSISPIVAFQNILNPFVINNHQKLPSLKEIKITAILDTEILVNNEWYKIGERIRHHKILSIYKDKVILLDTKLNKKIERRINYE